MRKIRNALLLLALISCVVWAGVTTNPGVSGGSGSGFFNGGTINGTTGAVYTMPSTSATIARTDSSNTFTGNQFLVNSLTVGTSAGYGVLSLGTSPSADSSGQIKLITSNANTNWDISTNAFTTGALEFTPSTAGGGSTFSTPTFKQLSTGATTITGPVTISTGGSTSKAVCWKSGTTLGYCSTVVDSSGACTCN